MVPKSVRVIWLSTLFAWALVTPTGLFAWQDRPPNVSVSGEVRDTTGLVLAGAMVQLESDGPTLLNRSTVSVADGTFVIPDIVPGPYRLRVSFPAFESFDETLIVDASPPRPLIIVLALSGLQEQVSVRATGIDLPVVATMVTAINRRLID